MANEEFELPRLAAVYDLLDADRRDLDLYVDLARRTAARSVLDIGCGTGVLAIRLASLGLAVTGVDPAAASLDVARAKPGAERVTWLLGDVARVPRLAWDLIVMTGNAAQQITDDEPWRGLLERVRDLLSPHGRFVFETRVPAARAWEGWTRDASARSADLPGVGVVDTWTEVRAVRPPLVAFRSGWTFASDGVELTSDSVLRFRDEDEVRADLAAAGLVVVDVLDAPDRPGAELVVVAERSHPSSGPVRG